jgi:hypothetical protein
MPKAVLIEGAEISSNASAPSPAPRYLALTASGDDMRAFLAFCLAASLLSVYTFAWATGLYS